MEKNEIKNQNKKDSSCCGASSDPIQSKDIQPMKRRLVIEFMYLDLSACTRCQGTENSLEEAISEVTKVLETTGVAVEVRKIHVQSEDQARRLGFVSSPTISINGRDIQLEVKESLCESCCEVVCGEQVDCRVWVYQGKEYTVPPKEMIIEAILKGVYGSPKEEVPTRKAGDLPDNLKRFFAAKRNKEIENDENKDLQRGGSKEEIKKIVREGYAKIAKQESSCCPPANPCCGSADLALDISKMVGYTDEELKAVPESANLGLGCGNPVALASLTEGETVLDLGSGAGFDCFLAANKVGNKGRVIGVDMTLEMIEKARENAWKGKYENVEFRLGELENLPVADNSVDIVISNCVINLVPDKRRVFMEAFRVLKPGGRIAISDIALLKELPNKIQESIEAYVGCVGGAILIDEYKRIVEVSGLKDVKITVKGTSSCIDPNTNDPIGRAILDGLGENESLKEYMVSVYVEGHK